MLSLLTFLIIIILKADARGLDNDNGIMTIDVEVGGNCTIKGSEYTFTDGQNVSLVVTSQMYINYGWWQLVNTSSARNLSTELKTKPGSQPREAILHTSAVDKSMEGTWEFTFYYFKDLYNIIQEIPRIRYDDGHNYLKSVCRTNVKIGKCLHKGKLYKHGEQFGLRECAECVCHDGKIQCTQVDLQVACPPLPCHIADQFTVPGECCKFCPGVDYCSMGHSCDKNATCMNLNTKYTCMCNQGFQGDGLSCQRELFSLKARYQSKALLRPRQ